MALKILRRLNKIDYLAHLAGGKHSVSFPYSTESFYILTYIFYIHFNISEIVRSMKHHSISSLIFFLKSIQNNCTFQWYLRFGKNVLFLTENALTFCLPLSIF